MISTDLSNLLEALYAAPLEPEKWQEFVARLCNLVSISCGYLIGTYHGADSATLLAGGGANFVPEMFTLYDQHYAAQDPYVKHVLANPRVGLIEGDALYDRAMLVRSEVYNDFLQQYDLNSTNVLMCSCTHNQLEGLSLWRGPQQGALDSNERRLLEMLLPHLQIALRLRAKVMGYDTARVFAETALDTMAAAALLVAGDGRVLYMNKRATSHLKKEDGLALRGGRLVAGSLAETTQLENILRAATFTQHTIAPGGAIRVKRPSTGNYIHVAVVPAPDGNQLVGNTRCAVVFVSDPMEKPPSRTTIMRQLYDLTPTESRLANFMLQGLDTKGIAEKMKITLETARFHMKRVLLKTGTGRQSELLRLMLSLPGVAIQEH